jgi:hypothetical protein
MLRERNVLIGVTAVTLCLTGITLARAVRQDLEPLDLESDASGFAILNYAKGPDKTEIQVNCSGLGPNTECIVLLCNFTDEETDYIELGTLTTNKEGKGTLHARVEGDASGWSVVVLGDDDASVQLYGGIVGGLGLIPVPIDPLPVLWITGRVSVEYLGGEPGMEYCGHRFKVTFESNDPDLRLRSLFFDFNQCQNADWQGPLSGCDGPCAAYGTLCENRIGFYADTRPWLPAYFVDVWLRDLETGEFGITSGQQCVWRFLLETRDDTGARPNAPDLAGTMVRFRFSNNITVDTALRETGNFFIAAANIHWSPAIFAP